MDYTFSDGALVELQAFSETGHSFTGWGGDLAGLQNPIQIVMDAGKSIVAMFTEDAPPPPPPNTDRILTVTVEGRGSVMVNQITEPPPPPPPEPGVYDWKVSNIDSGADWNSPQAIDYGVVKQGDLILLEGTFNGSWVVGGRSGISFYGRNFIIQNGNDRGIDLRGGHDLFFGGENNDKDNFKVLGFDDKHFRIDNSSNLIIKALHIETPNSGGQTDCIYAQNSDDITVKNSNLVVNNQNVSPHCDCFQGFRLGGNILIEGNTCLQNNNKDTNNQGIYITTPSRAKIGTYRYLNNYLGGVNSAGGRSKIKNCLTVRVLPTQNPPGHPVPVEIRGNEVVSDGYNYVYLTGINDYNPDIREVNDFSKTRLQVAGVNIS